MTLLALAVAHAAEGPVAPASDAATAGVATTPAAERRFGPLDRPARGVGIGLLLGYPVGISGSWRGETPLLFDLGLGWAWGAYAHIHVDVAYTLVELPLDNIPDTHFPLWMGVGARLRMGEGYLPYTLDFGARVPVGLAWQHDRLPFEVFAEAVPGWSFYPRSHLIFEGGVGFRFYFDSPEL